MKHVSYLGRSGAGLEGARPEFFDKSCEGLDAREVTRGWAGDRHHFRFIISPEHGDRIADLRGYVREVMSRVATDLGQPRLNWVATCHFDTDQPHAHVLVRGKREDGRDLVIPPVRRLWLPGAGAGGGAGPVGGSFAGRRRAADLARDAGRSFHGFDRRLLQAADADHMVPDAWGGRDSWAALTRGRLLHLEKLGLAAREGRFYRLDAELEGKLRVLQVQRDVIRTLNEQRLQGAKTVRELEPGRVSGQVVRSGFHDEMGVSPRTRTSGCRTRGRGSGSDWPPGGAGVSRKPRRISRRRSEPICRCSSTMRPGRPRCCFGRARATSPPPTP